MITLVKAQRLFAILVVFGSLIGFLDSVYLVSSEARGSVACDVVGFNCNAVLTSVYSKFFGIPLAWWGVFFYFSLFLLAVVYLDVKRKFILQLIEIWLWSGFVVSLILLYIQAFVLKAFCIYCLISEIAVFGMVLGYLAVKFLPKDSPSNESIN